MQTFIRSAKFSDIAKKIGAHHHDAHQILYIVNGNAKININHESFILKRGSLIFISRMESHSIDIMSENYERFEIRISPHILTHTAKNTQLYSVLLNRPKGFSRVIYLPPEQACGLFREITAEYQGNSAYREEMLSSLLDMLFINIYRLYPQMFSGTDLPAFKTVQSIQQQFENDIGRKYTLSSLAQEHHLSKYYLSHIFKSVTGYSVIDYLKSLRIARAKALLAKSNVGISEIVKICGFSDSSNFSREFKAATTLSPRDFRKSNSLEK